jgi:hypothetical protein
MVHWRWCIITRSTKTRVAPWSLSPCPLLTKMQLMPSGAVVPESRESRRGGEIRDRQKKEGASWLAQDVHTNEVGCGEFCECPNQ